MKLKQKIVPWIDRCQYSVMVRTVGDTAPQRQRWPCTRRIWNTTPQVDMCLIASGLRWPSRRVARMSCWCTTVQPLYPSSPATVVRTRRVTRHLANGNKLLHTAQRHVRGHEMRDGAFLDRIWLHAVYSQLHALMSWNVAWTILLVIVPSHPSIA